METRIGCSGWNYRQWAERIRRWPVGRALVYFNNDWEAFAVRNAARFRDLVSR